MANRIEVNKLLDGPRNLIYHVYVQSDGASGDIENYVLVDPANEEMGVHTNFTIEDITWSLNGFAAKVHFEFLVDHSLIWVLGAEGNYADFKKYGGLKDRGNPADATGKILFSTMGLVDVGDEGSFVINLRKG